MRMISPHQLGATLYMPALQRELSSIVIHSKIPGLRSMVACLEDALSEKDIEYGLDNLKGLLLTIESIGGLHKDAPLLFVRPRDTKMAKELCEWSVIKHITGFVLPKFGLDNIEEWAEVLRDQDMLLMPTLETPDVFEPRKMVALRDAMKSSFGDRILALRIGGNDLMGCLSIRRPSHCTIYETPIGTLIHQLIGIMKPAGFDLTGPVCEIFGDHELLSKESEMDVHNGLIGKTIIHPSQIPIVHQALKVSSQDYEAAKSIVKENAGAVFQLNGAMCEPATHLSWAKSILERFNHYGIKDELSARRMSVNQR